MSIDLDSAARAREELQAGSPTPDVVFRGERFALPRELPFGVFLLLGEAQGSSDETLGVRALGALCSSLFGEDAQRFLALGPSLDDMAALVSALMESYDFGDLPNREGLPASPAGTGTPSKPISSGSTGSTSDGQSGWTGSVPGVI